MERVALLYTNLMENIPFAFLKLNDGEIKALNPDVDGISRGAERSSTLMAQKLLEALNFRRDHYYIGLPCSQCHSSLHSEAMRCISQQGGSAISNVLSANALINSNLESTLEVLKGCMGDKRIVIVTNPRNIANIAQLEQLNIKPYRIIEVVEEYAFDTDYERVRDEWKTLQDGDIVVCLCGPLGRVLCYEWFKENSKLTCLELGSMFDPLLQGRSYIYHTGNHQYCEECYPSQEAKESSLLALCAGKPLNKECYYFYSWEDNENFYQRNYEKIKRNAEIRLEKEPGNTDLEKIIQKCEQKINCVEEIDYRNNNKTQLFQLAEQFYNSRNLVELDTVCDLYIDYFGKMDSPELHTILFYSSFANFNKNQKKAMQHGEQLYDNKGVAEDLRFYIGCNLSNIYTRDPRPIPKIIHFLFFGETKFEKYHYECICSTVKHMPSYGIVIHNKIEPMDNLYWDKIKKKVIIEKIDVPEYFDGYKLNHFQYKADVVRLEVLYEKGGVYLDIDMLIIKNFEHIISTGKDLYISEEGEKGSGWINAFIAAKPKNEFLKLCLENFKTGFRMENWAWHMRDGNRLLVEQHPHYNLKYNIEILESKYFFPFSWTEREKFIHIEDNLNEEIYGIHLFETILYDVLWNNKYFNNSKETTDDSPQVKNLDLVTMEMEDTHRPYDEILVLTLEEFPDRQEYMKKLLYENTLEGTLLIHKLHDAPILGCLQSHMNAIEYAKKHQLKSVMIFEDDILINDSFKKIETYPENWDVLYFGGILAHYTERKDGWVKGVIWCNHAYIVKDTLYDKILETYEGLDKEDMVKKGQTVDWLYTTFINSHYNCWLCEKQAIIQKDGFSLLDHKQKWGNNFDWSTWSTRNLEEHSQIVPIVAITVSTNFSDLLEHCLINQRFFKEWYIITDKKDQLTIDLIERNNKNNKITILYHDFQNNGRTFDKGGAIRNGQEIAYNKYPNDLILLLDSDVILPSNFMEEVLHTEWKEDTLYRCEDRWNYLTYDDYKNNRVTSKMSIKGADNSNWLIAGYFELYLSKKILYNASDNCSECDLEFHHEWEHSEKISMIVSHLGIDSDWPAGQNHWNGRKQILNK